MVSNNPVLDPSDVTANAAPGERSKRSAFNALLHGAAAETTYIPGEDPAEREALMEDAFNQHKPCSLTESALVAHYVNALWILARRQRAIFAFEAWFYANFPDAISWEERDYQKLGVLDRYKTTAERSVQRNLANLRAIRKDQFTEEKAREQLAIQREKLALEREKFEFKATPQREAAAAIAEQIEKTARIMEDAALRRPDLNKQPIQFDEENKEWIIEQSGHIAINGEGKACVWEIEPSHAKVREIIERRQNYENEPVAVVRHFLFTDGLPKEYQFLVDDYEEKIPNKNNFSIILGLEFDDYLEIAAMEDKLPEYLDPEEAEVEAS